VDSWGLVSLRWVVLVVAAAMGYSVVDLSTRSGLVRLREAVNPVSVPRSASHSPTMGQSNFSAAERASGFSSRLAQ
jgi:hypothetical protein